MRAWIVGRSASAPGAVGDVGEHTTTSRGAAPEASGWPRRRCRTAAGASPAGPRPPPGRSDRSEVPPVDDDVPPPRASSAARKLLEVHGRRVAHEHLARPAPARPAIMSPRRSRSSIQSGQPPDEPPSSRAKRGSQSGFASVGGRASCRPGRARPSRPDEAFLEGGEQVGGVGAARRLAAQRIHAATACHNGLAG